MQNIDTAKQIIGRAEQIAFPEAGIDYVHARIDTGARTSSVWVSSVEEADDGLYVVFLGDDHEVYSGAAHVFTEYQRRAVASSNGQVEERYAVRMLCMLGGRRIRAWFTLANRSTQVYPVLVGRNVLRGKFIVDVTLGEPLREAERERSLGLQSSVMIAMKKELS